MLLTKEKKRLIHGDILPEFDLIRIGVASPEKIRSWSYGEVKKPETINYRTFRPEKDGLFCAAIFGPMKDYECLCGKYKRIKFKGTVCEKCNVEVTISRVRRERMGHIELASPVAHVWFVKSLPSRISMILDLTFKDMERVLYFESYIVTDPGLTPLSYGQLLSDDEYYDALNTYGEDSFAAEIGAEALKIMLKNINLQAEFDKLNIEIEEDVSDLRKKKILKRIKLVELFMKAKIDPSWMVMDVIPVIPPDLRPLVPLDGGRFATSDLNDLYRRVINRNNRLKRLIDLKAPEIIIRNERRMLQESVDALFDNGRRGRPILGSNKRPLKSLADMLKGKQGRFRQNLLGKRVDYSGRSVIVVGPELKLHQCGLPKKMALELFRPFIYSKLERYGLATTLKAAKKMVEKERPEVFDVLEDVVREHPILLNRAPTLHRLGIQAFEPLLIDGKAIQLHPLVCTAFNADFDGDQMAVHVPLSLEAQLESRVLMMSTNNILSPSSGRPIIIPSKDIVLGIYYLSLLREGMPGEGKVFSGISEIELALEKKMIHYHSNVKIRVPYYDESGNVYYKIEDTTPGRFIISRILPKSDKIPYSMVNQVLTSGDISQLVDNVHRFCGPKDTVVFVDQMMFLGFSHMTKAGISFGKDDLVIPKDKSKMIQETKKIVSEYEQQYLDGLITQGEKYNKVIDAWDQCTDKVADAMMKAMSNRKPTDPFNSVFMMIHSKARGSVAQMKQLAGMRGLMAKPTGDIIETPIISNFKEGLNVIEYFISTNGARKGLTDTALKTANSGYLTRRLVDVAQDCIIHEEDCGTSRGLKITSVIEGKNIISSLYERILGRCAAGDIKDDNGEIIIENGTLLDEDCIEAIKAIDVQEVYVRSVLTCQSQIGVCAKCYGRDLARGNLVNIGEAVGVIAAQSIGEPGTQLTLRTFHVGGVAQRGVEQSNLESSHDGKVKFKNISYVVNRHGNKIIVSRNGEIMIVDGRGREQISYRMNYGARLLVDEKEKITKGKILAEWDPYTTPFVAEKEGRVHYIDLVQDLSMREVVDESTGIFSRVVLDWKQQARSQELRPILQLRDDKGQPILLSSGTEARYFLPMDTIITVDNNALVQPGDVIARIPRETKKTRDITGGLPRVSELFEARLPKDPAILSEIAGRVEFGKDYKSRRRLIVVPHNEMDKPVEYFVPKGGYIVVHEGDMVEKGDLLVDGSLVPQDILRILGVEALACYLVSEIQKVYHLQGVPINDKHIEIVVRQMLQKTEVTQKGDSEFVVGEQIDRLYFDKVNKALIKENKAPAVGFPVLQGITRASLHTNSFISAASFQETTRVLTDSALSGRVDVLTGLKENVIVGRLIPAGTGEVGRRLKKIAKMRDLEYEKGNFVGQFQEFDDSQEEVA